MPFKYLVPQQAYPAGFKCLCLYVFFSQKLAKLQLQASGEITWLGIKYSGCGLNPRINKIIAEVETPNYNHCPKIHCKNKENITHHMKR